MLRGIVAVLFACLLFTGVPGLGMAAPRTGGVEGTVMHRGKPVRGAVVRAAGQEVRTDPDGAFRLAPVPLSGAVRLIEVSVRAEGLGAWTLSEARVLHGDTLRISAELRKHDVRRSQPAPRPRGSTGMPPTHRAGQAADAASTEEPPAKVRVYITGSAACDTGASGSVESVDFKQYVKHVLPNEWIPSWHEESLRAGAMAAKSYAWHYINKGDHWPNLDADVMDSTCDQVYTPDVSYASTDEAVDDTWEYRITKGDEIHICQYWAGQAGDGSKPSGEYAGRMSQWGSQYWADEKGKGWRWILRYYYSGTEIAATQAAAASTYSVEIDKGARYSRRASVQVAAEASSESGITHVRLSNSSKRRRGVLTKGATYAYGKAIAWSLKDKRRGGSAKNGARTVYAQWRDAEGEWSPVHTDSIILDTARPRVGAPTHRVRVSSTLGALRVPVRFGWRARDATSGVARYEAGLSRDGGPYKAIAGVSKRTRASPALKPGRVYRLRLRARDRAGNRSRWVYGRAFALRRYQETHGAVEYPSGDWERQALAGAYGKRVKHASIEASQARFSFEGSAVAWVAPKGPRRGEADVYVDGERVRTVSLHSAQPRARKVVFVRRWKAPGKHTLELRVVGTDGHPRVDVDAFVVLE